MGHNQFSNVFVCLSENVDAKVDSVSNNFFDRFKEAFVENYKKYE